MRFSLLALFSCVSPFGNTFVALVALFQANLEENFCLARSFRRVFDEPERTMVRFPRRRESNPNRLARVRLTGRTFEHRMPRVKGRHIQENRVIITIYIHYRETFFFTFSSGKEKAMTTKIVSADSHIIETARIMGERLDGPFRDRAPHVVDEWKGKTGEFLICEGRFLRPVYGGFPANKAVHEILPYPQSAHPGNVRVRQCTPGWMGPVRRGSRIRRLMAWRRRCCMRPPPCCFFL